MEVDYDTFAGSVVYGDIEEVVATTQLSLPAVNDKEKFRDTPVQIKVVVVFEQPEVAEMISRDVARDGAVQFDLRFAMTCIEENSWWSSKSELQLWTFCENVMMVFRNATMASIGSMMGPARYCTVYAD
ncbi:hypothetical protein HPP92_011624 [Vanilla planifolia]|uniref:Uncharacterized protein n=1 Tax=Vanilla planifolia TaxID=51239 RepID=A0A835R8T7_VANPL|nr:hypothetical protein HPP92_011624 [Vanilla planifolia]